MSAMTSGVGISVEEYLSTSYRPDCDYIDGELLERNVGQWDHSRLQTLLSRYLSNREKQWSIVVAAEQRVQIKPIRFRVTDLIAVAAPAAGTPIVREPPLLCIEILSPDDRMREMQERIDDYLSFGVACVWVIDPETRRAFVHTSDTIHECKDGILRAPGSGIEVPLADLD